MYRFFLKSYLSRRLRGGCGDVLLCLPIAVLLLPPVAVVLCPEACPGAEPLERLADAANRRLLQLARSSWKTLIAAARNIRQKSVIVCITNLSKESVNVRR